VASDLELLAHHEAGHAAVAWALGVRLVSVRIDPQQDRGATVSQWATPLRSALVTLAGGRAEKNLDPASSSRRIAAIKDEVWLLGELEARIFRRAPDLDQEEIDRRREAVDARLIRCCLRIVQFHWPSIRRLAAALIQHNEIEGPRAEAILAGSPE
jgi:hypothetical protein